MKYWFKLSNSMILLLLLVSCSWRDYSAYFQLKEPHITDLPRQKMLVSRTTGDPSVNGGQAIGELYKMLFTLKRSVKEVKPSAPRARWPVDWGTPKQEWVGIWGLPVPETVQELPAQKEGAPPVTLEYWEYGTVAEILHVGPYSEEKPTIEKLNSFITEQGYQIAGQHEEEYVKGPGMIFRGNPKKYLTVIRYQVKKREKECDTTAANPAH